MKFKICRFLFYFYFIFISISISLSDFFLSLSLSFSISIKIDLILTFIYFYFLFLFLLPILRNSSMLSLSVMKKPLPLVLIPFLLLIWRIFSRFSFFSFFFLASLLLFFSFRLSLPSPQALVEKYPTYYKEVDLSELAYSFLYPLLTSQISSWDPLLKPAQFTEDFLTWRVCC